MIKITSSIGLGGRNKPVDVMIVQHLLNLNRDVTGFAAPLTGTVDAAIIDGIKHFQQDALGAKKPDGRVDAGGQTFAKLSAPGLKWIVNAPAVRAGLIASLQLETYDVLRSVIGASRQARVPTRPGEASSSLSVINHSAFVELYELQCGKLGAVQRAGLAQLIEYINEDLEIWDVGWCAYMLATVKRECGGTWQPIPEGGRGAGHAYGNPAPYTGADGKKYANVYYGRGYVQLTWKDNYLTLGKALGYGDDLAKNPELALDPDIAYAVMSYGMRNGSFSKGETLARYINANRCDYVGARRIINGQDVAALIEGYAKELELLLRVTCYGSFSISPARGLELPWSCPPVGVPR
jgi:predicted chitinase